MKWRQTLLSPIFADRRLTGQAHTLHIILLATFIADSLFFLFAQDSTVRVLGATGVFVSTTLLALLRRGEGAYVRLAGLTFVGLGYLVMVPVSVLIAPPYNLHGYLLMHLLVGILFGRIATVFSLILTAPMLIPATLMHSGSMIDLHGILLYMSAVTGLLWAADASKDKSFSVMDAHTAQLEAEIEARQHAEDNYRALLDSAPTATFLLRVRDQRLLYVNPAALRLLEVRSMEELDNPVFNLPFNPSRKTELPQGDDALFDRREGLTLPIQEHLICGKSGKRLTVRMQSRLIMHQGEKTLVMSFINITDLKNVEHRLRESEERYRAITELSPLAIVVFNLKDMRPLYWNPAWAKMIELEGKMPEDVIEQVRIPEFEQEYQNAFNEFTHKGTITADHTIYTLKGRQIQIFQTGALISFKSEPAMLVIVEDVTEKRAAEAQHQRNEHLTRELEKERQVRLLRDSFIAMISHEVRTPLAVMRTSSDLLKQYVDLMDAERRLYHLEKIDLQIGAITEILDSMLLLSRARAGMVRFKPRPLDLCQVIQSQVDQFAVSDTTGHRVLFNAQGHSTTSLVDEDLVRRIMRNLLSNAAKFSSDGSLIRVELQLTDDSATLSVTDEGIGVSVDEGKLFEPFVRGNNIGTRQGTGLGLALVKSSAELHGGTITYRPVTNGGTTFVLTLPLHATQAEPLGQAE